MHSLLIKSTATAVIIEPGINSEVSSKNTIKCFNCHCSRFLLKYQERISEIVLSASLKGTISFLTCANLNVRIYRDQGLPIDLAPLHIHSPLEMFIILSFLATLHLYSQLKMNICERRRRAKNFIIICKYKFVISQIVSIN